MSERTKVDWAYPNGERLFVDRDHVVSWIFDMADWMDATGKHSDAGDMARQMAHKLVAMEHQHEESSGQA